MTPLDALRKIAETAQWYANNGDRLPNEVDHALCVEVLSLAMDALYGVAERSHQLIRVLTADELLRLPLMGGGTCHWRECEAPCLYALATPLGRMDVCDKHVSEAIAELPADFIGQWESREPYEIPDTEDIPF